MYIAGMYPVGSYRRYPKLIGRIVELGLRQADLAVRLDIHPTLFNAILRGRREAPEDFEERVVAELDLQEAAEKAAQEARERFMAEAECEQP